MALVFVDGGEGASKRGGVFFFFLKEGGLLEGASLRLFRWSS